MTGVAFVPPPSASGVDWFPAPAGDRTETARWSYTSLPVRGTCKIDGRRLRLRFRLAMESPEKVPDVLGVERKLADICREPGTVEDYAKAAAALFGGTVTVVGRTRTHGPIRVTLTRPNTYGA